MENSTEKDLIDAYNNHPDLSKIKTVLVIFFKHIGDVILSTPVYSVLKNRHPHLQIDALVNKETAEMLQGNPNINEVISYDRKVVKSSLGNKIKGEIALYSSIRNRRYDMVISLDGSNRGRTLSWYSGAKINVGSGGRKKIFFGRVDPHTHWVRHTSINRHYLERHLDNLRRIGIYANKEERYPQLFESQEVKTKISNTLQKAGIGNGPYILIHPTSRWMFKCWPAQLMGQLIDKIQKQIQLPIVITAAPDPTEADYITRMKREFSAPVIDLTGQLTLMELIPLIRAAKLFIGVDSAPMHMASATNTPTIVLFGPSDETDWGPVGKKYHIISASQHICRPCQLDGCGGGRICECMNDITVDEVFAKVEEELK
ncbi:MAG: putative lipopolysaccharide heptosyltransferase III [Magnetococcales bacterium]|nr:putative lipopolysaccharide heptosyltransferase III [Magnetococcales bacterium]